MGLRILVAMAIAAVASSVAAQQGPARVIVDPVRTTEVAETQPLIARLVAINESVIATRVAGIVGEVNVRVGDRVDQGDPVVTLDTELLAIQLDGAQAKLSEAQAGVAAADANMELAQQTYQRIDRLRGSAAFSQGRLEDLASEMARARAELTRAETVIATSRAEVAEAEYNIRNATVRAPFGGVVVERMANVGEYLSEGSPVASLVDDRALEIEADVPTEIVAALRPSDRVGVLFDDGTFGEAEVRAVVPSENASTRTRPVRFALTAQSAQKPLAVGQTVTVQAPVGSPRAVTTVAKDALVQQRGGWIVYAARDGAAQPVPVTIGSSTEDRFEVNGALNDDDVVITRGNERLRPGQPVTFEEPAETSTVVGSHGGNAAAVR